MSRRSDAPPTPKTLERAALSYLNRWAAPRNHLRRVLLRRIDRGLRAHGGDRQAILGELETLLDRLERLGWVNDKAWSQARARKWLRRGVSPRTIQSRLLAKGIDARLAHTYLTEVMEDGPDPALLAALRLVRRRRIGPYRLPSMRSEERERDLAKLGRAGFTFRVAQQAVDWPDIRSLEDHIRQSDP